MKFEKVAEAGKNSRRSEGVLVDSFSVLGRLKKARRESVINITYGVVKGALELRLLRAPKRSSEADTREASVREYRVDMAIKMLKSLLFVFSLIRGSFKGISREGERPLEHEDKRSWVFEEKSLLLNTSSRTRRRELNS